MIKKRCIKKGVIAQSQACEINRRHENKIDKETEN